VTGTGGLAACQGEQSAVDGESLTESRILNLWKDADPSIPIYKAAKAEYAKLQQPNTEYPLMDVSVLSTQRRYRAAET
jgi:hypothetical protein